MIAEALLCLIVGVSDGDTLTARCPTADQAHPYQQLKVRLAAIDAPERRQPYGERARQALAELTFQRQARLECGKQDRYRRHVCNVWVAPASAPNGPQTLDAGLAMVSQGMAWWYRAYSREQTAEARGQYEFAETEARARRAGLWNDPAPVAPWKWRRKLVDTDKTAAYVDGVYLLQANGQLFIKRGMRRMDGRCEVFSDNPSVRTVEVLNGLQDVAICKRVVNAWNGSGYKAPES